MEHRVEQIRVHKVAGQLLCIPDNIHDQTMQKIGPDPLYFGGKLIACYVYMVLCADGENVHIKIGISQDPQKRVMSLYNNSPLAIEWMALVDLSSRDRALALERAFHDAFAKWRTNGEWFRFAMADKPEFNRIQLEVLAGFASPSRKLSWTKLNVRQLVKQSKQRQRDAQRKWRSSGLAYRDAVSAGLRS